MTQIWFELQGVPIRKTPIEKRLYFSDGSTDLGQTFTLYMGVFTQHILQISLKQFMLFNGYNNLNFKIKFTF